MLAVSEALHEPGQGRPPLQVLQGARLRVGAAGVVRQLGRFALAVFGDDGSLRTDFHVPVLGRERANLGAQFVRQRVTFQAGQFVQPVPNLGRAKLQLL